MGTARNETKRSSRLPGICLKWGLSVARASQIGRISFRVMPVMPSPIFSRRRPTKSGFRPWLARRTSSWVSGSYRKIEQTAARMCQATVETAFARNASSPVSKSNKPTSSPISHIKATLSFWKSLMDGLFPSRRGDSGGEA